MITEEAGEPVAAGTAGGLDQRALIGTMAGTIQTWVNLLAFLLQAFLVSRIFKYIGVRGALFILPIIALGSYASLALLPVLRRRPNGRRCSRTAPTTRSDNTTRHALFLPTSRAAKYKAKQAIDSFFWRAGDLLQAVVVFIGVRLAFDIRAYALVNLVLVAMWLLARRSRSRASTRSWFQPKPSEDAA